MAIVMEKASFCPFRKNSNPEKIASPMKIRAMRTNFHISPCPKRRATTSITTERIRIAMPFQMWSSTSIPTACNAMDQGVVSEIKGVMNKFVDIPI